MLKFIGLILITFIGCKNEKPKPDANFKFDNKGILALIVQHQNDVIFEHYADSLTADDLCNIQSLTKGIMAILTGIAIDKGILKDENEELGTLLPQLFSEIEDERKQKITIKNILNQKTGLEWKGYTEHSGWLTSATPNLMVLNKPLIAEPGTIYNYNSGSTHLLSVILTEKTGKNTMEFASEHLFEKLEIPVLNWEKRGDGNYDGSGLGLEMRPKDLLKIGQLIINEGKYNEEQIVSKKWVEKLTNPVLKSPTEWGVQNSTHGYCWYYAEFNNEKISYGMGYGGQFILLIPERELIIVSCFNHDTPDGIPQQIGFLNNNLPEILEKITEDLQR